MREIRFKRIHKNRTTDKINITYWGFLNESVFIGPSSIAGFDVIADLQFTGLKDKNGKEIYEGDICKNYYKPLGSSSYDRWYHYVLISFSNQGVGTKVIAEGRYQVDLPKSLIGNTFADYKYHRAIKDKPVINSIIGVGGKNWEIIGNIHQNKDLL